MVSQTFDQTFHECMPHPGPSPVPEHQEGPRILGSIDNGRYLPDLLAD